ncbi:hypothetical protein ACLKA7_005523 [Drosophila subpalustris]
MSALQQKSMAVSASTKASGSKTPTASSAQKVLSDVRMAITQSKENNPFVLINIEDNDSPMPDVERSGSKKESLSFLVKGIDDVFSTVTKALEFLPKSFTSKLASGGGIFITPISPVARLKLIDYFEKLKFSVVKDLSKTESKFKVVIKDLPSSTPTTWIKNQLNQLGFSTFNVENLKGTKTGDALNLFKIELNRNGINKEIFQIKTLGPFGIKVEEFHGGKKTYQCFRCQKFDHKLEDCTYQGYKCFKCSGPHFYTACTKPDSLPGRCTNCNGNHIAAFTGCPYYKRAVKNQALKRANKRSGQALHALDTPNDPAFDNHLQRTSGSKISKRTPALRQSPQIVEEIQRLSDGMTSFLSKLCKPNDDPTGN